MEKHQVVSDFFVSSAQSMVGYNLMQIYNMDETTCYLDMASDQTLYFKGDKNADGIDTGYRKSRLTVTLCCCADGRIIKTLIVFKGLKNVPKLNLSADVEVTEHGRLHEHMSNAEIDSKLLHSAWIIFSPYTIDTLHGQL